MGIQGFSGGTRTCLPMQETQETRFPSLAREDPLEAEMATHSSILAWRIPWTEELGGLQFMGSQSNLACTHWVFKLTFSYGPGKRFSFSLLRARMK